MHFERPATPYIGVRGMPERDIESLGVMWGGAGGGEQILSLPLSPPALKVGVC